MGSAGGVWPRPQGLHGASGLGNASGSLLTTLASGSPVQEHFGGNSDLNKGVGPIPGSAPCQSRQPDLGCGLAPGPASPAAQEGVTQALGPDPPGTKSTRTPSRCPRGAAGRHRSLAEAGPRAAARSHVTFTSHLLPEINLLISPQREGAQQSTSEAVRLASPEGGAPESRRMTPKKRAEQPQTPGKWVF